MANAGVPVDELDGMVAEVEDELEQASALTVSLGHITAQVLRGRLLRLPDLPKAAASKAAIAISSATTGTDPLAGSAMKAAEEDRTARREMLARPRGRPVRVHLR